jgi:hypothetical protein
MPTISMIAATALKVPDSSTTSSMGGDTEHRLLGVDGADREGACSHSGSRLH